MIIEKKPCNPVSKSWSVRSDESVPRSGSGNPGILVPLAHRYCLINSVAKENAFNLISIIVSSYYRESFPPGINMPFLLLKKMIRSKCCHMESKDIDLPSSIDLTPRLLEFQDNSTMKIMNGN